MRKILILLVLCAMIAPLASAITANQVVVLDQRGYMPSGLFIFVFATALVSLVISYHWDDEMSGFIAIMTAFAAMWTSRAIDYVTGVSMNVAGDINIVHTIYKPDIMTLMALILFIISLLNEYRIYVLYSNAKQDNQMQGRSGMK